jgi:branched-chain amino acid transport system permease protein
MTRVVRHQAESADVSAARPGAMTWLTARMAAATARPGDSQSRVRGRLTRLLVPGLALVIASVLPLVSLQVPWILPGTVDVLNSAGTLTVLGLCFVFAGAALGFDLLFGFTGLLSLGQVLYFAVGVYVLDIALSDWGWPLLPAAGLTIAVGLILAVALGSVSLKARGIAFAQAGYYLIEDNPHSLTGGATGLVMSTGRLPALLVGVVSTRNLYWLTLAFLAGVSGLVWLVTESVTGRVWLAIRDSEQRAEVLGLTAFPFKLASFVISSLIAVVGGMVYLLIIGTAAPDAVASTTVTISVLVMVVLGGVGTRWGAEVGAIIYVYLQQYLLRVAAEPSFSGLPAVLRVPLSQPSFLLGVIFLLFVLFAPGGIGGLVSRIRARRLAR